MMVVVVFVQVAAFMQYLECSETGRSRNRSGTVLISRVRCLDNKIVMSK